MYYMRYILIIVFFLSGLKAGVTRIDNNITSLIVDNTCFNKTFNMPLSTIITSVDMDINITHTWRGDLNLTLTSPLGTSVDLTSRNGGSANNIYVHFSDSALTSIVGDTTNYTVMVNRRPEVGLNAFNGENALGIWTLQVCDNAAGDTGTYSRATLDINDTVVPISTQLQVDYRMDECFWLGNAAGVLNDVKDSSSSGLDATSYASAQTFPALTMPPLCRYGDFNGTTDYADVAANPLLNTPNNYTISAWINPATFVNTFSVMMMKTSNYVDGFTFYIYWDGVNPNLAKVILLTGDGTIRGSASAPISANVWSHVVATYDGSVIRIYVNGVQVGTRVFSANVLNAATQPLVIGMGLGGFYHYKGKLDEVKMFKKTLSATEVLNLYNNELAGKNFDGTPRVCPTCDANLTASTWELVGIPADLRTTVNKDVATVFDELPGATYDTLGNPNDWVVYQRTYDAVSNSSAYAIVPYTGVPLEIGKGYWIISTQPVAWSENGLPPVDYNATNPACVTNHCIEINLVVNNKNFGAPAFDPNDGTGQYRNNMLGFVGHTPVNWADCRIVVTDANGTTAYTPSGAEAAGYAAKQVWQYNPGATGVNANGYTTCDDVTPGGCKLEPYKGFWVRLKGITKGTTVKLLIPKAL